MHSIAANLTSVILKSALIILYDDLVAVVVSSQIIYNCEKQQGGFSAHCHICQISFPKCHENKISQVKELYYNWRLSPLKEMIAVTKYARKTTEKEG